MMMMNYKRKKNVLRLVDFNRCMEHNTDRREQVNNIKSIQEPSLKDIYRKTLKKKLENDAEPMKRIPEQMWENAKICILYAVREINRNRMV